jgi:hypothetical protein
VTQSKMDVTLGNISFAGEGEQHWLAEQLDKVLKVAPQIARAQPPARPDGTSPGGTIDPSQFKATLASYIREKSAEASQVDRFLVTADWLRRRGADKLTTAAVSKALKAHQQKRLANAADSLNKNVSKGYCEKADGGFFITPDGLRKLGYES